MSATPTAEFLTWVADRLVRVHGESEHVDFVLRLRELAKEAERDAGAQARYLTVQALEMSPSGTQVKVSMKGRHAVAFDDDEATVAYVGVGSADQFPPGAEVYLTFRRTEHRARRCAAAAERTGTGRVRARPPGPSSDDPAASRSDGAGPARHRRHARPGVGGAAVRGRTENGESVMRGVIVDDDGTVFEVSRWAVCAGCYLDDHEGCVFPTEDGCCCE